MLDQKKANILVVDDEEIIRLTLQKMLSRLDYNVVLFEKAEEVLTYIKNEEGEVDLIITDINLKKMEMNGLELLRHIKGIDDSIPVVIISGYGNVEDAIEALRYGARDFIRKPFVMEDVVGPVKSILRGKDEQILIENFAKYIENQTALYKLPVEASIINAISCKLTEGLVGGQICDHPTAENITLALREAISNAMFHGNFEISSEIRETGGIKQFNEEIAKRKELEPYKDRLVTINFKQTQEYVEYIIEDEGPGFDYKSLPNPKDPENFFKNSGRGLLIIGIHLDEISWNDKGNIIYLKKYKAD